MFEVQSNLKHPCEKGLEQVYTGLDAAGKKKSLPKRIPDFAVSV
jgi:hypothetical protein